MKTGLLKKRISILAAAAMIVTVAGCSREVESSSSGSSSTSSSVSSSKSSSKSSSSSEAPDLPEIPVQDNLSKVAEAVGINDDVGGYLYIPDTEVDEPVVCAENYSDAKTFYATYDTTSNRLDWKKESTGNGGTGALYFHPNANLSSREELSPNVVIFGHNIGRTDPSVPYYSVTLTDTPDGPKFGQLYKYLDEKFATEHPYIYLSTEQDNLIYQVFAVFWTEAETTPKYYSSNLSSEDALTVAKDAVERSEWIYNDVELEEGDKFLTLSTCTYSFTTDVHAAEAYRFVVMGKLLPEEAHGEATADITKNESPKEPQV